MREILRNVAVWGTTILALGMLLVRPASGVVIDFEGLSGLPFTSSPYTEDGFSLSNGSGATNAFDVETISGTTTLASSFVATTVTLTQIGGGAFNLVSIDLSPWLSAGSPVTVDFVGQLQGGGSVTYHAITGGATALQTFILPGFQGVTFVSWIQSNDGKNLHQFDNIVVEASIGSTPASEPASLLLLALSLAALGFSHRKRAS